MSVHVEIDKDCRWDWPLQGNDDFIRVKEDNTHFEVDLDAKQFAANEIQVKSIGDLIEIHMDHVPRGNDSFTICRSITRCYKLPNGVDPKTLTSKLQSNGVLHITGQKTA
ncbi:hypothetical protein Q1695_004767 [Nippostrongylus brasiliensis]|nr:hypothetical protein Q1695_004767 [Nippostrongylus brasiliensis]